MAKVDERVLTFVVSGAMATGAAACSKEQPTPKSPEVEEHINEGPVEPTGGLTTDPAGGPPSERLVRDAGEGPEVPSKPPREIYTNTNRMDPPPIRHPPAPPSKDVVEEKTNTGPSDEEPLEKSP